MKEARYEDPKFNKTNARIACIIPLFIPQGRKKDYGYFVEDKFETLKKTLAAHKHFKPGVAYDLILVNNESPQDVDFFQAQGFQILNRENEGFGFCAWKHAWLTFGHQYDFYLFTEDDNAPAKDDWLLEIVQLFLSESDIGAVGNFVEAHGHNAPADEVQSLLGSHREGLYCFDGAFTFTSSSILDQVDKIGGLPVFPCLPKHERSAVINELAFQQPILELGYKLVSFSQRERMLIHGSELYTGDLLNRGPVAPIINHNAGWIVPEVADIFKSI